MSSTLRAKAATYTNSKFEIVRTPAYYDNSLDTNDTPVPFIYNNGELDIKIIDNVQIDFIDDGDTPYYQPQWQGKQMGGLHIVTSLGPKMLEWLQNMLGEQYEATITDIRLYNNPTVTKMQFPVVSGDLLQVGEVWAFTNTAPPSEDYIMSGTEENAYRTTYVFKSPMTVAFKTDGTQRYFTMFSTWY